MIRSFSLSALFVSAIALGACAQEAPEADAQDATPPAIAEANAPAGTGTEADVNYPSMMRMTGDIIGVDGNSIGMLNMLEGPNGVMVEVGIEEGGLTPGWHGLHLHQVGDCSDTGEYKMSGGHVGKIEGGHGFFNPAGPEEGDLPNIHAAADGSAAMEAFSTFLSLSDLKDDDGAAMIIHEGRDDQMTQPIGGAGARVACAVIK